MLLVLSTSQEFKEFISSGKVVVDFYATWCGKCRNIAPYYKELADQYAAKGIKFAKFDTSGASLTTTQPAVHIIPVVPVKKRASFSS